MTAAVSLDIEHMLLSGLDASDGMLLQISDTSLLRSENDSMELCSVVALGCFFNNTVLSFCISW